MDANTNEQLSELLAFIKKGAEATTDFAAEQAPIVAREIVAWTFWEAVAACVFAISLLIVGVFLGLLARRWKNTGDLDDSMFFPAVGACLSIAFGCIVLVVNVPVAVKCVASPRLVIIDYIGRLTK